MLGWSKVTKLHFIGIGGIGMSGIAEVLLELGYKVSGSDLRSSLITENLKIKGAEVFIGHRAENIEGSTLIIHSSAINKDNPELLSAQKKEIPVIPRAEMLAELMRLKYGIAVAGSHGKTTTTSLVATIFNEARLDSTYIIGGVVSNLGGNAKKGDGQFLIAEADESDGSFLLLNPIMAAITNIDDDHLDYYGSRESLVNAFIDFVNKLPFYGKIALNANDPVTVENRTRIRRPIVWYGLNCDDCQVDYLASDIHHSASGCSFNLSYKGDSAGRFHVGLVGLHNTYNTLAAISLSHQAGISWEVIRKGLESFKGVGRRLEKIYQNNSFLVVDDYGHHPTEIKATISSLSEVDKRPLCVIFEPHRYSRTQNFWVEFQDCFEGAEEVYISPIYAASEDQIDGINSLNLVQEMKRKGKNAFFIPSLDEMKGLLMERHNHECIFVTLGAGGISKKIRELVAQL